MYSSLASAMQNGEETIHIMVFEWSRALVTIDKGRHLEGEIELLLRLYSCRSLLGRFHMYIGRLVHPTYRSIVIF